jgi:adenosylcobinamide-GDP ribazoletransferase
MNSFWTAWQFLTRLPTPPVTYAPEHAGRSVLYYPLVGAVIGAILAVAHVVLGVAVPQVQAALLSVTWVAMTGGLHLDGLADSADAWAGSQGDRERALAIMKDARSGPAGVTAIALVLVVKFAALSVLLQSASWSALLVAPMLGRAAIVALFLTTPYVRPEGLGAAHAAHLPRAGAWLVLGASGIVGAAPGTSSAWAVVAASVTVYLLRRMMRTRLGGATGDTLGGACELTEAVVLVVIALGATPAPAAA